MALSAADAVDAAEHAFVVEAFTLLAIAVLFVFLRTFTRLLFVGIKQFQFDDYLMLFALVTSRTLYGIETGAAYMVVAWFDGLANNGMTPEQRISLQPDNPEYSMRVSGSKVQLVGWNIYTLLLWTLKLCMCKFYSRLTNGLENMQIRIRIGYVAIGVTYLVTCFSITFGCRPITSNWQIYPDPGDHCQPAISTINCLVTVVLNVTTDLYLMSIPLPLMWASTLPICHKLLFSFMFGGGFFVIACGILRAAIILAGKTPEAANAGSGWAVRETFVAIVIGNIPMVYQLVRRTTLQLLARADTARPSHVELSGGDGSSTPKADGAKERHAPPRYRSYKVGSPASLSLASSGGGTGARKSRYLHPLSLRNTTLSESQEELQMRDVKDVYTAGCVVTDVVTVEEQASDGERAGSRGSGSEGLRTGSGRTRDFGFIYAGPETGRGVMSCTIEESDGDS